MEESINSCKNCLRYGAFYIKRLMSFEKQPKGFCSKKKIVDQTSVCKNWICNYSLRRTKKTISTKMVCKMAEDLNVVRQILEDIDT